MMEPFKKKNKSDMDSLSGIPCHHLICDELNDPTENNGIRADAVPCDTLLPSDIFHDDESRYHERHVPLPQIPLIQKGRAEKRPKAHDLTSMNYNLINDRRVGTLHMPVQIPKLGKDRKDTRTKCGICGSKITIRCAHCDVGLCIADRGDRNCWREFHTREILEYFPAKAQQTPSDRHDRNHKQVDRNYAIERNRILAVDLLNDVLIPS